MDFLKLVGGAEKAMAKLHKGIQDTVKEPANHWTLTYVEKHEAFIFTVWLDAGGEPITRPWEPSFAMKSMMVFGIKGVAALKLTKGQSLDIVKVERLINGKINITAFFTDEDKKERLEFMNVDIKTVDQKIEEKNEKIS